MVGAQIYPTKILAALNLVGYQNIGYLCHLAHSPQMLPVSGDLQPIAGNILASIWLAAKTLVAYGILHIAKIWATDGQAMSSQLFARFVRACNGTSQTCPLFSKVIFLSGFCTLKSGILMASEHLACCQEICDYSGRMLQIFKTRSLVLLLWKEAAVGCGTSVLLAVASSVQPTISIHFIVDTIST